MNSIGAINKKPTSKLEEKRQQLVKLRKLEAKEKIEKHDLNERIKELHCLYEISRLSLKPSVNNGDLFQKVVNLLPSGWQYPSITSARIVIDNNDFKTNNFRKTQWRQVANINIHNKIIGKVEIAYLEKKPVIHEGPFLQEERQLINAVAEHLGQIAELNRTEEQLSVYQTKLRSLAARLSLAGAHERQRIATELHHRINQFLVLCQIKLGMLEQSAPSATFAQDVVEIKGLIQKLIQDIRAMIFEISSPLLHEIGIEAALEHLTEQMKEQYGILFSIKTDKQPKPLDADTRILLFQMVRELLMNVVKHAQAHHVKVRVMRRGTCVDVTVDDDGVGFDVPKVTSIGNNGGFGLFNIREQINHIGGQVKIESHYGCGSRITLSVPVSKSNHNK